MLCNRLPVGENRGAGTGIPANARPLGLKRGQAVEEAQLNRDELGQCVLTLSKASMAQGPPPVIVGRRLRTPLTAALLLIIALVFAVWGLFSYPPISILLWILAALALVLLGIVLIRGRQRIPRIEASAVYRLIVCQSCGVESEGPFQAGDYVFRTVGKCPRCKGTLYIKALYSPEEKSRAKEHKKPVAQTAEALRQN